MTDAHVHIERGEYTKEWIDRFAMYAEKAGLDEVYLLEHSHRFVEFAPMYAPLCEYSEYQRAWIDRHLRLSIKQYEALITEMRKHTFPIKIKWGLEVCYSPGHEKLVSGILGSFDFDFAVGSIHWIDGFGFDHKSEFWDGKDTEKLYRRYYELMTELARSRLFTGLAHPDSIKCFGHEPPNGLESAYNVLADELIKSNMYAEQNGGLYLNCGHLEMGMNKAMLNTLKDRGVRLITASDAHKPEDTGKNIVEMSRFI